MMELAEKFKAYMLKEHLFRKTDRLLLAVSGGVDSIVMCDLCKKAEFDFLIAHCNFQLRGAESERDATFVKELGNLYGVEVLLQKFDTEQYAAENKLSIQVAARQLRYDWFAELLAQKKANVLLTAHHANDNIETLLMNFFKGTGISGLRGILPRQRHIARPLLFAKKEEIQAYAAANSLEYVEDSSNASDKYSRNYFRNQLLPGLQKVYPQVEDNLLHNLPRFREVEVLYRQAIELHKKKLIVVKGKEIHIPVLKLLKVEPLATILYEVSKNYGFSPGQTDELIGLLKAETGKYVSSGTHRIFRNRNWLIISPLQTKEADNILITGAGNWPFANGVIEIKNTNKAVLSSSGQNAQLDAGLITFPLILRKRKTGDYFYPLGMQKKKKINRFLSDLKLSLSQKEKVWVLEMDKKIIWVVGHRIDDRFKIKPGTENIFAINYLPAE